MQYGHPDKLSRNLMQSLDDVNFNLKLFHSMSEDFQNSTFSDETQPLGLEMPETPSAQLSQLLRQVGRMSDSLSQVRQDMGKLIVHQEYTTKAMVEIESRWKSETSELHDRVAIAEKRLSIIEQHSWRLTGAVAIIAFAVPYFVDRFFK